MKPELIKGLECVQVVNERQNGIAECKNCGILPEEIIEGIQKLLKEAIDNAISGKYSRQELYDKYGINEKEIERDRILEIILKYNKQFKGIEDKRAESKKPRKPSGDTI